MGAVHSPFVLEDGSIVLFYDGGFCTESQAGIDETDDFDTDDFRRSLRSNVVSHRRQTGQETLIENNPNYSTLIVFTCSEEGYKVCGRFVLLFPCLHRSAQR